MARKPITDLAAFQASLTKAKEEGEEDRKARLDKLKAEKERKLAEIRRKEAEKEQKERDKQRKKKEKEAAALKGAFEAMRMAVGSLGEEAGLFGITMPSTSALRGALRYARKVFENADAKEIAKFERIDREESENEARARAERAARRARDDRQDPVAGGEGAEPASGSETGGQEGEAA